MKNMMNPTECKDCDYYEYIREEYPSSEQPVFIHSYHRCSKSNKIAVSIEKLKTGCIIPIKSIKSAIESTPNSDDPQKFDYDIAFSYASEQKYYVDVLAIQLKNMSIKIFYDEFEEHNLRGKRPIRIS